MKPLPSLPSPAAQGAATRVAGGSVAPKFGKRGYRGNTGAPGIASNASGGLDSKSQKTKKTLAQGGGSAKNIEDFKAA